ncbi:unnamed protein product [Rotaria sp. Silwood1]|nr:unnamed protein product [Rotaria sp. Silwood1]CAF1681061.1 unnamed protein product [Rotaria sp. Silwood1]CAF3740306.1 unnamed protein product [Rotaria sp. Silwood1]CAF3924047.1 unnamed protein product [Rotaria sp. Silwood1]
MVITRSQSSTPKRTPSLSSHNPIHRSRSKLPKKVLRNNNVSKTISFTDCKTITRTRSSSSNSSSASSIRSSRSSSSSSYTDSSCSSSDSSTISSSSSGSDSPQSTTISSIIENIANLEINNSNNFFSSISTSFSQQSMHLPQAGPISVYKSSKGGDFLCLHGYIYQIDRRMINKIKWKCQQSRKKIRCGTKIYTTENVGTDEIPAYKYIESNNVPHSHDEDHDQQKIAIFKSQLKFIGTNNRTVPSSKLINQLATDMKLTDTQLGKIPYPDTLYKSVYRARSKRIPPLPKSINFEISAAYATTSSNEKFIFFDRLYAKETKRIIAFASPMQLKILFSSKLICIDGTFSICPRKHKQLLIIQTIDEEMYDATPVLYALLNGKKAYTYTLLFRALKNAAKQMNMKLEPNRIISDYESGFVSTVKKELPNTIHQGCLFHLYQRLTKKIKKFDLWYHYKNNDVLHLFIKKIMAIVLLKPRLIDSAYDLLANQYLKLKQLKQFRVQLTKFMLYFQQQWIKLENRAMISFYDVAFKTNNWSEKETAVRMKYFQLLNGKKKSIRKTIRNRVLEINQKIFEFNQQFEDNEIELDDCLKLISSLVGVKYDQWRKQLKKNKRRRKYDSGDDHDN